ncbi:MAG: hypothetical protein IV099_06280 [Phenylobacterium sp.]|uniref:hypothetical protein n=1 Tax=Phenylobacterium sp. TaxID=1871053 RepID=UPI0025E32604|nr:hypothetical protein [Phenylobacterium sp.]MBT9470775.1 hypothetical protein [Phenylobacterium sp.]
MSLVCALKAFPSLAFGVLAGLSANAAFAAPAEYRFDALSATVERGVGVTVQIQAVNIRTGQPVPDVEFHDPRVDRSPDGIPGATFLAFFVPGLDYGTYKFRTDFPTAGQWALTFQARIAGEPSPIFASVIFKIVDPARRPSLPGSQGPSGARAEPGAVTSTLPR